MGRITRWFLWLCALGLIDTFLFGKLHALLTVPQRLVRAFAWHTSKNGTHMGWDGQLKLR